METSDYRKLPACLNRAEGLGEANLPPEGFVPSPEYADYMARNAAEKAARAPLADLFKAGSATWGDVTIPYRYYVPERLELGKRYPLVLFLHGGGSRGTDNEAQLHVGDSALVWVRDQQEGGRALLCAGAPVSHAHPQPLLGARVSGAGGEGRG